MVEPYLPGAVFIDLGPDGGSYDELAHPKGCIHTTEGSTLAGAESAFRSYPPHIGYDPSTRVVHQYVRLDRCSYAFKGAESDDEFVIQVEIVGFANATHTWSDQAYRNVGEDIIAPLRRIVGIPNNYLQFHGEGEGIILASPDSPIRLSDSGFRSYSGWLGHQHVPAPDSHWDPGRFKIDLALRYSEDNDMELNEPSAVPKPNNQGYYTNGEVQYWDNRYINEVRVVVDELATSLKTLTEKIDALAVTVDGSTLTPVVDGEITISYAPKPEA